MIILVEEVIELRFPDIEGKVANVNPVRHGWW
jgi:hypothetical protein